MRPEEDPLLIHILINKLYIKRKATYLIPCTKQVNTEKITSITAGHVQTLNTLGGFFHLDAHCPKIEDGELFTIDILFVVSDPINTNYCDCKLLFIILDSCR